MIGHALPIRFSRRIKRKTRLLPVSMPPKWKMRKLGVMKKASLHKEKAKVAGKNKLEETSNQASKILKRASHILKPVTRKSPQVRIKKRNKRNSLKTHANLMTNNASLKNLELFDNSKKVIDKKHCKKVINEKGFVRRSLRLSKSSSKEKGKSKELSDSDLKPSKEKPSQKKSTKQVTTLNSGSVPSRNLKKCTHTPKLSGRKKSARLSIEQQNQEISVYMPASKSLALTPVPPKVTRIYRHSGNRKSVRLSKEPPNQEMFVNSSTSKLLAETPVPGKVTRLSRDSGNRKPGRLSKEPIKSRITSLETPLNTSSFYSLLETPQPEKHLEKRKSSRLLEPSPLRTLNKELPVSTPAYLFTRNANSALNISKSCRSVENLSTESSSRKQSKPEVSAKDGSIVSHEKRKQKQQVNQLRETSTNFKKPSPNETENLSLDIVATPAFKAPCARSLPKKYLSKSDSKYSKGKLNASASENQIVSKELQDAKKRKSTDFPKMPAKGTLKRKRWLLNNLTEKNGSYEDDIFENKNFDLYKQAFHFGDESDGSSVNIATPKFDCILTPALPKKTPRFKDCISPTEFLQARKTAEEYLYRRNKKRKSGDRPSSSGKKSSVNKKKTVQEIPEKKKLDFEETVNKLIAVQKNLEIEAEVGDDDEDSYFSDASN